MAVTGADRELVEQLREMNARQIVRWLATPARSGFFLSADDIARLGRNLGIRVAPFSRTTGLEQFLRGAALDERLGQALDLLQAEMADHLEQYRLLNMPRLEPWVERAEATLDAWEEIAGSFEEDEPGPA